MSRFSILLYILFLCVSCKAQSSLSDRQATPETVRLYKNLKTLSTKGTLFGHQDALAYGVNWKYEAGRSDVKETCGDYPAVYGWDLGGTERDSEKDIDGVPFSLTRQFIQESYKRGGITTLSWHMDNPLTGKNAWDTTHGSVSSVLPGGSRHQMFVSWLEKSVTFIKTLTDDNGRPIPILYRPYHELTGTWFWWCRNNATPEQIIELWKFTIDFYKNSGVHNFIYVFNASDFETREDFLKYYPGSDYADVLSFDTYQYKDPKTDDSFINNVQRQFGIIDKIAKEQGKIIAFAETGYEAIPYDKWWTDTLTKAMANYPVSYVLVWRNHGWNEHMTPPRMHYYAPFPGQVSAQDFIQFVKKDNILMEKDAAKAKLYTN